MPTATVQPGTPRHQPRYLDGRRAETLRAWGDGKLPPPWMVELRISEICNLKCSFCPYGEQANHKPGTLNPDDYCRFVSEAAGLGVMVCSVLGGGEALCYPKLTERVLTCIKDHGLVGWLTWFWGRLVAICMTPCTPPATARVMRVSSVSDE